MKFIKLIKSSNDVESQALATYLNLPTKNIKKVKDEYGLPTFEVNNNGETQRYSISNDDEKIKQAVAGSLETLFDGLYVSEFCKSVVPYLSGNAEDYLSTPYDDMSFDEQLESGMLDNVHGYEFNGYQYQGQVDFEKMAQDVIDIYGAAHELDSYDNRGDEIDFNGKTFQIFRKE